MDYKFKTLFPISRSFATEAFQELTDSIIELFRNASFVETVLRFKIYSYILRTQPKTSKE